MTAEYESNPFFEIPADAYVPDVASILVRFFMQMETNGHYIYGPTEAEAEAFKKRFADAVQTTRRNATLLLREVKVMVNGLDFQLRAALKAVTHMLRMTITAPNAIMDAKKMGLCVRAPIQGPLAIMMTEWDAVFSDINDM
jgi:outer membrane cobalamin receptor